MTTITELRSLLAERSNMAKNLRAVNEEVRENTSNVTVTDLNGVVSDRWRLVGLTHTTSLTDNVLEITFRGIVE